MSIPGRLRAALPNEAPQPRPTPNEWRIIATAAACAAALGVYAWYLRSKNVAAHREARQEVVDAADKDFSTVYIRNAGL